MLDHTATRVLAPLSDLYIHPLNTRSAPPAEEIDALAQSIEAVGLLQNLLGFDDPSKPGLGIVAGGRRLRALQLLHGAADVMIPVDVTPDPDLARDWAGTENSARAALHPADEVLAYRRMAEAGAGAVAIARTFAVTERHVLGRLKLAQLPDAAITALRAGSLTLDQAQALTVAQDPDAVLALLPDIAPNGPRHWMKASEIRQALIPKFVLATDRRAKFVGLDLYRDRGGWIESDLFTAETRLFDEELLETLFAERLEEARIAEAARGWREVLAVREAFVPWRLTDKMDKLSRIHIDLPDDEQAELYDLSDREHNGEEGLTEAEEERLEQLRERVTGDYDPEKIPLATAFICVGNKGTLEFAGAYLARGGKSKATAGAGTTAAQPETLPQGLRDDLRIIATLAIQTALLDKPDLVQDLLAVSLAEDVAGWDRPLALGPTVQPILPSQPDGAIVEPRLDGARGGMVKLTASLIDDVRERGKKARTAAITAALARTFCRASTDFGRHVAQLAGADVRKVWTPTAENYFKRLPSGMMNAIWAELVPDDRYPLDDFAKLKKGERAKMLHGVFHDAGMRDTLKLNRIQVAAINAWVPAELRFEEDPA